MKTERLQCINMNKLWPTVTSDNPCPICGKPDWCCFGDKVIKCMRLTSENPSRDGGWYHPYPGADYVRPQLPKRDVAPAIDAEALIREWSSDAKFADLNGFAKTLGVRGAALWQLHCCWSSWHNALAFPMSAWDGKMIGIRLRNARGEKWAVTGSRQGLFIPTSQTQGLAMVCEGPTDTAAALSLGYYAIGRPSCNSNPEQIVSALKRLQVRRVVIVCDDDTKTRRDGTKWSPGIDGARALAKALKIPHAIWAPGGFKDIREYLCNGATHEMVESSLRNLIWKR